MALPFTRPRLIQAPTGLGGYGRGRCPSGCRLFVVHVDHAPAAGVLVGPGGFNGSGVLVGSGILVGSGGFGRGSGGAGHQLLHR